MDKSLSNVVQETDDYTKFSFLVANRDVSRSHINNLKAAISQHPEILRVQPLLVNDKMQIIDGQHRFQAATELAMPISYTVVNGIGIEVARAMNLLHRTWKPEDFAKSYAIGNNKHYSDYLKMRDIYEEFPHGIVLIYMVGRQYHGINAEFRKGLFEVGDLDESKKHLDQLSVVKEKSSIAMTKPYAVALLTAFKHESFDYDRFLRNLEKYGREVLRSTTITTDYMRMIEEIYNHGLSTNRTRLF
jgi:urease gamma subunit